MVTEPSGPRILSADDCDGREPVVVQRLQLPETKRGRELRRVPGIQLNAWQAIFTMFTQSMFIHDAWRASLKNQCPQSAVFNVHKS